MGKREPFQEVLLGKLDCYMQNYQSEPLSHIMSKNKFKIR